MKIYTKTGDEGGTALVGGKRTSKSNPRLEAYGTIDELNSVIGCARAVLKNKEVDAVLENFQNELFNAGSRLACVDEKLSAKLPEIKAESVTAMEVAIDKMVAQMPELKNFILPGGHVASAHLHLARTVCRRAERQVVRLKESGESVDLQAIVYLNRMSDCLFTLARFVNYTEGVQDIPWKK